MSTAPEWLAALQARFSEVLTTPLDRSSGSLRARAEVYDERAVAAIKHHADADPRSRLAVYNRQYWFRLFTVMQSAYSLCARAMGYWDFNALVAGFVVEHPPRGWDLDRLGDGFDAYVERALDADHPRRAMVLEAARVDGAWRSIMREPVSTPFQVSPQIAARLLDARLVRSPSVALVHERWSWIEWRAVAMSKGPEAQLPLPTALAEPRWWALVRERNGARHVPLEPREGALFALLDEHTVRDAMSALEALCPPGERAALPARAQQWLARGVQLGLWTTVVLGDPAARDALTE